MILNLFNRGPFQSFQWKPLTTKSSCPFLYSAVTQLVSMGLSRNGTLDLQPSASQPLKIIF